MTHLTLQIDEKMSQFLLQKVMNGQAESIESYLHDLIERERLISEKVAMEQLIINSIENSPAMELTVSHWDDLRLELVKTHGRSDA